MSRNASGTYALPAGNPVSPGTTITTNWANSTLTDIGASLTDSLSRTGLGGMQAALRLPEGTDPLPVLSFTADITAGMRFDFPTSELRMLRQSTVLQKWTLTGTTIPVLLTLSKGATVTTSTTNGNGLASTGNGTASGMVGTGGATAGVGVAGVGGAGGGTGMTATGVGTGGFGLVAVGGTGTSAINATGGAGTSGGLQAAGSGAGTGVAAIGGSSAGAGLTSTGGAGGKGAVIAAGTAATGATPQVAAELTNGHLLLSGAAPNSTVALANALTPGNIAKVVGRVRVSAANTAVIDSGFNVASASITAASDTLVVTFATAFATSTFSVIAGGNAIVAVVIQTTTTVAFQFFAPGSAAAIDLDTVTGAVVNFACYGVQ